MGKTICKITALSALMALTLSGTAIGAPSSGRISTPAEQSNAITVRGKVVDSKGEPMPGASVMIVGTSKGVITSADGTFEIEALAGASLQVEFIGFVTQTVSASPAFMNIVLVEDTEFLDEVVVVGYGVQKKKLVTGSTINIDGDLIKKQNTTNAMGSLYSSVPGVSIIQENGQPWADYKITVRGLNTTGSGSSPLYVIDGVAGGSISSLNPADIESIDILKDAASAAIYGARAAAGVVLVTTRQGKSGKVNISFDAYYGFQKPHFNGVSAVGASEYMELVDAAFRSNGALAEGAHYYDLEALMPVQYAKMKAGTWDGTNWLKEMVNKNAPTHNEAISINGGNDIIRFSLGFSNSGVEGTLGYPQPTYYNRRTIRLNTDVTLLRNREGKDLLKFGENATLSLYDSRGVSTGNIYSNTIHKALVYTPFLPAYNDDGTYYTYQNQLRDGWNASDGAYNLIEEASYKKREGRRYRLQSNFYLEYTPVRDLKLRASYGYRYHNSATREYTPVYQLNGTTVNEYDRAQEEMGVSNSSTFETTASWSHTFGDHHVDALVGTSLESTDWGMSVGAWKKNTKFGTWEAANITQTSDDINAEMVDLWGGNTIPFNNLLSYFGRVNYNYKEKYMATAILRADGSSNFAKGHRWGYFPSFSAGWIMTNEPWMESSRSWLDMLKIRGSWGQNGNCEIENFQYLATVSLDAPYDFSPDGSSLSIGAYPDILPNKALKWETTEQTDLGFDARMFKDRLSLVFDLYRKDTKDWLVQAPSLASYGTGAPVINGGAVRNQGVEIGATWRDHISDFSYSVGVNASYNKNKVLYIDCKDEIIHGGINVIAQNISAYNTFEARAGMPIGYFCGIASEGIFQNQAQIDRYRDAGYSFVDGYDDAQPGDVIWIDQNKDGVYDINDVVKIGDPHPDWTVGFNINLEWKGFDLAISGSGSFGQQILQSYRNFAGSDLENYTNVFVKKLWTGEGSTNSFPRFSYGKNNNFYINGYVGDIWAQNGDFLKIRNITLGYDFKKLFKSLPFASCRLYVTGQNLITFTGYDGMDPEVGYGYGYSWTSGIDIGYYPSPKVYMAGVSINF